ncbi:MAG: cbb3-type cytochrome c oxidase subunit 3 [Piscirickettsiaceae bacterium]|nr:cbb3-type cytochrome c oxidase subunit 3 [Piscirickettsiaceae bacterium]
MTSADWFGMILTVVVFIVMVIAYYWVLNPKNKESLEAHRTMILDEDEINAEKQDGR